MEVESVNSGLKSKPYVLMSFASLVNVIDVDRLD